MVTFYAFPERALAALLNDEFVESPFASVRLRTDTSHHYKLVESATALIWKMI